MKDVFRKIKLTDSDMEPNSIPLWKDDEAFMKWTDRVQSIARQLQDTKAEQWENQAKIEERQAVVVQARSAVILEEGSEKDLQEAESSLAAELKRVISLALEVNALDVTHARRHMTRDETKTSSWGVLEEQVPSDRRKYLQ